MPGGLLGACPDYGPLPAHRRVRRVIVVLDLAIVWALNRTWTGYQINIA